MLTEVKYNPHSMKPYTVMKKAKTGWITMGDFIDESAALALAKNTSEMPDLPCVIARFENGTRTFNNADC